MGLQTMVEGLLGDETGLGHGPLHRVHQEQDRIDHGQDPLHLAAEVGVAGGVDDVDAVLVPADGGVLREDGDTPLLLDVVGVHDPLHWAEALAEGAGLLEQLVDQGGLTMIDVGDDGDVAQVFDHRAGLRLGQRWCGPTWDRPCLS